MEFGRVSPSELEQIDFKLPVDPILTNEILAKGSGNTKFFIGCAKWGRKDWVGKLYPPKTKEKDFLYHYSTLFNSIEFNGTYYNVNAAYIKKWREKTTDDFLFCPKFSQTITHIKRLKNVEKDLDDFFIAVAEFKEKLGPIFLMTHPDFSIKQLDTLKAFIEKLPKDLKIFLELRNNSWYENDYHNGLYTFLKEHKVGTIITDTAGFRNYVHMHLSTPECFVRFVGNGLHQTDYERIDTWVDRINIWMQKGLEKCYFFMHQHDELHSPQLIKYFIEQLNLKTNTNIKAPQMHDNQLF